MNVTVNMFSSFVANALIYANDRPRSEKELILQQIKKQFNDCVIAFMKLSEN